MMVYANKMLIPCGNIQREKSKLLKTNAEKKVNKSDPYVYQALFDHEKFIANPFFLTKTPIVFVGDILIIF